MTRTRLLEHTADIGLAARGRSPEELFCSVAEGLRALVCDTPSRPDKARAVQLVGLDWEDLLVRWLSEILWLIENGHLLPAHFLITHLEPTLLEGQIWGEPFDPTRQPLDREVKAVTYHRLLVRNRRGRWQARVYFDL